MEDELTPLARKLIEVCPTEKDFVEILTMISDGIAEQLILMKNKIDETCIEINKDIVRNNNISEWQKIWKDKVSK